MQPLKRACFDRDTCFTAVCLMLLILNAGAVKIDYDVHEDWYSDVVAKGPDGCHLPPKPQSPPPPLPTCRDFPPGTDVATARAQYERVKRLGWRVAPKVHFHPLESSFLTDYRTWLARASIYDALNSSLVTTWDQVAAMPPSQLRAVGARMLASHLWPNNLQEGVTNTRLEQVVFGDRVEGARVLLDPVTGATQPFQAEGGAEARRGRALLGGRSTSRQYYTATNPHNFTGTASEDDPSSYTAVKLMFTYFYGWNGCSNQVLGLNLAGRYQGSEYVLCPFGVHEGDVERINLWVCASEWDDADPSQAIKAVQYPAHDWIDQYNCTVGECAFMVDERGDRRLVTYAALFSHANYPQASPLNLYASIDAWFVLSTDGIYIGDRTSGLGPVFLPDANNTVWLPFEEEMTEAEAGPGGAFRWATYPGAFGGSYVTSPTASLTCLAHNLTATVQCNTNNPANWYLKEVLQITYDVTLNASDVTWETDISPNKTMKPYISNGPLFRVYTYTGWEAPKAAPLWSSKHNVSCPLSGDPSHTKGYSPARKSFTMATFLGLCAFLLVGAGVVFSIALHWPRLHSLHNPQGKPGAACGRCRKWWCWGKGAGAAGDLVGPEIASSPSTISTTDSSPLLPLDSGTTSDYYALRHTLWMGIGVLLYIAGIVMAIVGLNDVFEAINRVKELDVFNQIKLGIIAALVLFGSWEVIIILLNIVFRSQRTISLGCLSFTNPLALWRGVSRAGWRFHNVVAGLLVIEINTTVLLFTFGVFMWIVRYGFQEACFILLGKLFSLTPLDQLCVDLTSFGVDVKVCGSELEGVCSIWVGLKMDLLVWGSLCFILSHLLFLVMCVHQSSQLQTLEAVNEAQRAHQQAEGRGVTGGEGGNGEVEMMGGCKAGGLPYTPPLKADVALTAPSSVVASVDRV